MSDPYSRQAASVRWTHVLLRIFAGAILFQHGAQKMFGLLGGVDGAGHAANVGLTLRFIAGPLEVFGGALIVVGLFTPVVAFILSGEMAVVYFLMHFGRSFWPIVNQGEVPVMLCFVFLYLATTGAGVFSLDYLRNRRKPTAVMG